ncbi:mechanosensitive ion channel family protein [Pseudoalteromonas sp. GB56]
MITRITFVIFCLVCSLSICAQPKVTVKELLQQEQSQEETQREAQATPQERVTHTVVARSQDLDDAMPMDEFNRGTPRSSMQAYLNAARKEDYEMASNYLDFRNVSDEVLAFGKPQLAEIFYLVLDRTLWVEVETLSAHPKGKKEDFLPSYRDFVGEIKTSQGPVQILMQRVPAQQSGSYIWKISNATVAHIPLLKEEYGYSEFGTWLYKNLPHNSFLGVKLWQWVYYSINFLLYLLIALVITQLLRWLLVKINPVASDEAKGLITGPLCFLLAVALARNFASDANSTLATKAVFDGATLLIVAWTWFFVRVIDVARYRYGLRLQQRGNDQAVYLLRPLGNVLKITLVVLALFMWLDNLGFSVTTLVAGLGIGGIAIALAAQKSVENIIGAITLYTSAPVKVGQLCRFGNDVGTVEEIGLRATRIRTLNRSVIHVPNAHFVDMELENISERERIAYRPEFVLDGQTDSQQVESFKVQFLQLLNDQDDISSAPCRVRFVGFVPRGLQIEVLAYLETTDFATYVARSDELNLKALSLMQQLGVKLAPPEHV